jgi:enoyl-CoA hydratase/carnithine racemase
VVTGIYADMDYNEFLMNDILETKQEGRVLRVWLNCPDQSNSLTTELCRELVDTLDRAEKDGNVGSVLLAGRGESFCTGMDLNELATGDVEKVSRLQEILFTMGARLTKPLIGAVQGAALASGTGVVANCHVVIASENATFGLTGIRLGLWPFVIFHAVSAAVGERRAIAMTITGEVLSAAEALRTGLVHKVVPIGELEQRALEVAQTVANYSSHAMHTGLGFVRTVQGQTWKDAAGVGRLIRDQFLKSTEFQADLRVFLNQKLTNQGKDVWRPEG